MDRGVARGCARWFGAGLMGGGLAVGAWLGSAASAAADSDEDASPEADLADKTRQDQDAQLRAGQPDGDSPAEAADDTAAEAEPDEDGPPAADFNDPEYPGQFTLGDMENQWYDTAMDDCRTRMWGSTGTCRSR